MNIANYNQDGANRQAKAVLAYITPDIEESWTGHEYTADITVARWENCREQGYVLSLINKERGQLNIAFFEHRNCDNIHAIKWEQNTLNSPTIDTAEFGDAYEDKWDTSYSTEYGEVVKMAEWIDTELGRFYNA